MIGTHNGNIVSLSCPSLTISKADRLQHVISLPTFQSLRFYHAHTASVTSISISPFPPPLPTAKPEGVARVVSQAQNASAKSSVAGSRSPGGPRTPAAARPVPNSPSNAIYIATSSLDGNVCIASLVDLKDVQLRNFARPVQAVALSPDYKNDRTYLSGGLAGNFVLTIGGLSGASTTSSTTGSAAAVTQSWLGTIGLAANTGKDTILHSGEGTISTIKWSLSGKYVVWINEHGIKIMRTPIQLDSQDVDAAWKRIAHVDRPRDATWDEMATVWKARAEWIDDTQLESDEGDKARDEAVSSPALKNLKQQATKSSKKIEKLLVGWGGTIWIINVHPGGVGVGKHAGERTVGRAEIVKILRMDCIVSGLSLYTPTLLLVLAYVTPDKEDDEPPSPPTTKGHKSKPSTASTSSEPSGGIRRRQNALSPELRLIDLASSEEVDTDTLTVSRFERLSSNDYHLGVLPPTQHKPFAQTTKGTLETLSGMGSGMWDAAINAATVSATLLSSAASIRSNGSKSDGESSSKVSGISTITNKNQAVHQHLTGPGMKIFIHSPYDCILSTKRDLSDHVTWLLEQKQYEKAWKVIDEHPEVISSNPDRLAEIGPGTLEKGQSDIFYDDMASTTGSMGRLIDSAVEKEKRRIGELWIQQLVNAGDWTTAGQVCGKVLGTSPRWEHWVWTFAGANKFDEITPYIPTAHLQPPLPSTVYEVVLGHYIHDDRPRLRELLEQWAPELFDIRTVTTALENELKYRDVREDSVEDGEQGRDWRIVMESLGKLYAADGRPREALKCYIRLHDADAAMSLIKEYHLVDAVADDVPAFILLRVSEKQEQSAPLGELEEVTSEAIALLVDESRHGLLRPEVVVKQLQDKELILYLFFYLRSLWRGHFLNLESDQNRERLVSESRSLVDDFADLAVQLFGTYDRPLLMEFLRTSTFYSFEKVFVSPPPSTRSCHLQDPRPAVSANPTTTSPSSSTCTPKPAKLNAPSTSSSTASPTSAKPSPLQNNKTTPIYGTTYSAIAWISPGSYADCWRRWEPLLTLLHL